MLKFGGGVGGRLLIYLFCRSVANFWKNTYVKPGKYTGGLLTLISLMMECNFVPMLKIIGIPVFWWLG